MSDSLYKYWITPRDVLDRLNAEFNFDCDPAPFPLPYAGYSSLNLKWGARNYVNPPFNISDCTERGGITAFVRKAIKEQQYGNESVLILPVPDCVNMLVEAGAEIRSLGRSVRWISTVTGQPWRSPRPTALFILRSRRGRT